MVQAERLPSTLVVFFIAVTLTSLFSRCCFAANNRNIDIEQGIRRFKELAEFGPRITNEQYKELMKLYYDLCLQVNENHRSFHILESAFFYFRIIQSELLKEGWRVGAEALSRPYSRSLHLSFKEICAKIDVFRTRTETSLPRPHFEDSSSFQRFEVFRQQVLAQHREQSLIPSLFHWLFSLIVRFAEALRRYSSPILNIHWSRSNDGYDQTEPVAVQYPTNVYRDQHGHSGTLNYERTSFHVDNQLPSHEHPTLVSNPVLNDITPPVHEQNTDNSADNSHVEHGEGNSRIFSSRIEPEHLPGALNSYDGAENEFEENTAVQGSNRRVRVEFIDEDAMFEMATRMFNVPSWALQDFQQELQVLRNIETDDLDQVPLSGLPALHVPGYGDEECEQFILSLNRFRSKLNEHLWRMQTFANEAGLLKPSQVAKWRNHYQNFIDDVKSLGINSDLLTQIMKILKKRQKSEEDRALEEVFLNRGYQVAKYLEEIARIERSMEVKRRLPNSWQTYCDTCLNPFQSGKGLTVMQLLEYPSVVRDRNKSNRVLSKDEVVRELDELKEPDSLEETSEMKDPILPSAIEELNLCQKQDQTLPQEIVFCGVCGYRICRICVERIERSSACKCPVCAETLMVPTVSTLTSLLPAA